MRKYSSQFVKRNFIGSRRSTGVCPFPGKYPLRMLVMFQEKVLYHGKFHAAAWKGMQTNLKGAQPDWYSIYDKAGCVLWGGHTEFLTGVRADITRRYLPAVPLAGAYIRELQVTKMGPYAFYFHPNYPQDPSEFVRQANTTPHVRSI